jgi:hypothetical protein
VPTYRKLRSFFQDVYCPRASEKNTFAWGFGRYKFQHEPIFYCHVAGQKDPWYGDKSQSTLWQENKPAANRLHPTMKPVELIERALLNSSKAGDIVADLFGGSGSTLIGCERRGRKARLMEIDPKYADCIVRRYQEYTGKQAVLEGDGRRSTRSPRSVSRRRHESSAAAGRSRPSKRSCWRAIQTSRGWSSRLRTGRDWSRLIHVPCTSALDGWLPLTWLRLALAPRYTLGQVTAVVRMKWRIETCCAVHLLQLSC